MTICNLFYFKVKKQIKQNNYSLFKYNQNSVHPFCLNAYLGIHSFIHLYRLTNFNLIY